MALIQLAICMCEWKWGGNRSFSPFSPLCYSVTHSVVSPHMPEVTKCYTASQGKFIKSSVSVFIWLSRGTAKPEIFFDPKVVTRSSSDSVLGEKKTEKYCSYLDFSQNYSIDTLIQWLKMENSHSPQHNELEEYNWGSMIYCQSRYNILKKIWKLSELKV